MEVVTDSGWGKNGEWGKTSKKRWPPTLDPFAVCGLRCIKLHHIFCSYLSIICPYPILLSFFFFNLNSPAHSCFLPSIPWTNPTHLTSMHASVGANTDQTVLLCASLPYLFIFLSLLVNGAIDLVLFLIFFHCI